MPCPSASDVISAVPFLCGSARAFVRRGMATYLSYRVKLSLGLASLSLSVLTFSLVGRVVEAAGPGFVLRYGTDYASFAVVGVAVHAVAGAGLSCFRAALRREQLQGTLEILLTTKTPLCAAVFFSGLGELVIVGVGGAAFLAAARLFLGVVVDVGPWTALAVLLYGLFMSGLGLASAGCILVSKEGEPVSWLFSAAASLLGGVYFPIDMMPAWLQRAAWALPTTHALSIARGTVRGGVVCSRACSMLVLAVCAVAALSIGFAVLRWGAARARRLGTLGEY